MMMIRLMTISEARQLIKIHMCRTLKLLEAHHHTDVLQLTLLSVLVIDV